VSELLKVEVNCNFLVVKYMVEDKEVVNGHVRSRVNQAINLKELLEVFVILFVLEFIFKFNNIEILLRVPEFIF
jgi:hypothetical protein